MKFVCCFVTFLLSVFTFSQAHKYSVTNLKINTEHPHFGLMPINKNNILFTSYLLDKKGRVEKFQGAQILTIFQGYILSDGQIGNVIPLLIDEKEDKKNITSAAISPDETKLYITKRYTYKNKPNGNFNMDNFHIEVGEYKEGIGWTNFKVLPFCQPKYS